MERFFDAIQFLFLFILTFVVVAAVAIGAVIFAAWDFHVIDWTFALFAIRLAALVGSIMWVFFMCADDGFKKYRRSA